MSDIEERRRLLAAIPPRIPGARYPIIGQWSANVAYLLAHEVSEGGGCWVSCGYCKTWTKVDLAKLVIKMNPLASLWNRHPPCPTCAKPMTFHAVHAPNARVIPLQTDDPRYTDDLHAAWKREKRRLQGLRDGS